MKVSLPRTLFAWPSRHNVHLALPLMILLAFVLHIGGLALFQGAYPRAKPNREQSAQVYFLRPGSPEAARVMPLIDASDPALFSPGRVWGRDIWKLPETGYIASFDVAAPALESVPNIPPADILPPVSSVKPVAVEPGPSVPAKVFPGKATVLHLDGDLQDRAVIPPDNIRFSALPRQNLTPSEYLVAVSPEGKPMHIFPLFPFNSSGNEALDRTALRYLAKCQFAPAPEATEAAWGVATFLWGNDVQREKSP